MLAVTAAATAGCTSFGGLTKTERQTVALYLENAANYYDAGRYDSAYQQWTMALNMDPTRDKARLGQAMALYQLGEEGFDHADAMPEAPPPEDLLSEQALALKVIDRIPKPLRAMATADRPIELRPVVPTNPLRPRAMEPRRQVWYRAAGENGVAEAHYRLAKLYRDGEGIAADAHRALEHFHKAAEAGHIQAAAALGWAQGPLGLDRSPLLACPPRGRQHRPGAVFRKTARST